MRKKLISLIGLAVGLLYAQSSIGFPITTKVDAGTIVGVSVVKTVKGSAHKIVTTKGMFVSSISILLPDDDIIGKHAIYQKRVTLYSSNFELCIERMIDNNTNLCVDLMISKINK